MLGHVQTFVPGIDRHLPSGNSVVAEQGRVAAGFQEGGGLFHARLEAEDICRRRNPPAPACNPSALPIDRLDRIEDIGKSQAVGHRIDFGVGGMTESIQESVARPPS